MVLRIAACNGASTKSRRFGRARDVLYLSVGLVKRGVPLITIYLGLQTSGEAYLLTERIEGLMVLLYY